MTAAAVSSGADWKTPKPMAGSSTPLFRVRFVMLMLRTLRLRAERRQVLSGPVSRQGWPTSVMWGRRMRARRLAERLRPASWSIPSCVPRRSCLHFTQVHKRSDLFATSCTPPTKESEHAV
ncbi:hypothetical protein ACFPRL_21270 [Pseudoclavibacter helvolus]